MCARIFPYTRCLLSAYRDRTYEEEKIVVIGINTCCVKERPDSDSDSDHDSRSHRDRDRHSGRFSFIQIYGTDMPIFKYIYSARTPFHRFRSYPFAPIQWSGLGVSVALVLDCMLQRRARCDLSNQRDCSVRSVKCTTKTTNTHFHSSCICSGILKVIAMNVCVHKFRIVCCS